MSVNRRPEEFLALSFWQKTFIVVSVLYSIVYFAWRATATVNVDGYPGYSWSFFAFDLFGFLNSLLFIFATWRLRNRESVPYSGKYKVDVYIPTINESVDLLRTTFFHVLKMDYPHETYVLDDGRRPEVQKLAESMGVKYISRPDSKHAKAGNVNHAMTKTHGDLIAIFDADGIPRRDFLTRLVGYFEDEKVALVQTPNAFYNLDSFQHWVEDSGKQTWHEQSLWYDVILRGLDYGDAAAWCGSGSIIRRKAIDDVGGVATSSVTEDTLTTLMLHKRGYNSVFHDEPIAFCLAPNSIEPYLVQRGRWAMGSVQILKRHFLTLVGPGKLTFLRRVTYLMTIYYFTSVQKIFYFMAPFLFLVFGISPVTEADQIVLPLTGYVILSLVTFKILARGTGRVFRGEVYFLHLIPVYLKAILLGLIPFFKGKFKVTSKDPDLSVPLKLWMTPALLFGVSGVAFGYGVDRMLQDPVLDYGVLLSMAVASYYAFVALAGFRTLRKVPISKEGYTFFDYRSVRVKTQNDVAFPGATLGIAFVISEHSVQVVHMGPLPFGAVIGFDLDLPDASLSLTGRVNRCEPWVNQGMDALFIVEMRLIGVDEKTKQELSRYFFEDATPRAMNTAAKIVRENPAGRKGGEQRRKSVRLQTLHPAIIEESKPGGTTGQVGLLIDLSSGGARMKYPVAVEVGSMVHVQIPWLKKSLAARVARCTREAGQVNPPYDIGVTFVQEGELGNEALTEFGRLKAAIG